MPIKVFVVDDSAIVRQALLHMLSTAPDMVLVGSAANPLIAMPAIQKTRPDVLLLDIEMPGMDGLTFLRQVMATAPIPTVICSTLSTEGSAVALEALASGAVAVLAKPQMGLKQHLERSREELIQTLTVAAASRPRGAAKLPTPPAGLQVRKAVGVRSSVLNKPVVIGCSTGGTQAVELILTQLPADAPGIAITQHMPEKFTAQYAKRLDGLCAMEVREARNGDRLERGLVLIAPGGLHMQLYKNAGQYYVRVQDGPHVNRHKPSVDVLFKSAAQCAGGDVLALLLTGMGDDGARGMKTLHDLGASTIAQSEESCVVFGMPREAIRLQAVDAVLTLEQMPWAIQQFDARPT